MNSLVALPIAAAFPIAAPSIASGLPIQADAELVRAAQDLAAIDQAFEDLHGKHGHDADFSPLGVRRNENIATLITVSATSAAGIQAKASALRLPSMIEDWDQHQQVAVSLADDIVGAPAIAAPSIVADNAKAIELGARYEPLLRQYVDTYIEWVGADKSDPAYEASDDRMCELSDQMQPIEDEIAEIEATSDAALRTVALKDLRYKIPVTRDGWELTDGWGDDLEMFWEVLRFVGLSAFARKTEQRIKTAIESRQA
jgi:hypothetical protein